MTATDPSAVPGEVRQKAAGIRLLVLDVDGVLTDGSLHFDAEGREHKVFHVVDGRSVRHDLLPIRTVWPLADESWCGLVAPGLIALVLPAASFTSSIGPSEQPDSPNLGRVDCALGRTRVPEGMQMTETAHLVTVSGIPRDKAPEPELSGIQLNLGVDGFVISFAD